MQLWQYLEHDFDARKEFGDKRGCNIRCYQWATGDYLYSHIQNGHTQNPGSTTYPPIDTHESAEDYIKNYIKSAMIADGLHHLGLTNNIPDIPNTHKLIAGFANLTTMNDYHFVVRHLDEVWDMRGTEKKIIKVASPCISDAYGLYECMARVDRNYRYYTYFIGWYAVPAQGLQLGYDIALHKMYDIDPTRALEILPSEHIFKNAAYSYHKKQEILQNFKFENKEHKYDQAKVIAEYQPFSKDDQNKIKVAFPKLREFFAKHNGINTTLTPTDVIHMDGLVKERIG